MNLSILRVALVCLVGGAIASFANESLAHGGGGDIALFQTDGQVDVGFAVLDDNDEEQEYFDPTVSVFQAVLIPHTPSSGLLGVPYTFATQEPGFDANEGSLPALANMYANVSDVWYWDGSGELDFQPASTVQVTGGYAPMPQDTDIDGGHHSHPWFGVVGDSDVPNGIYLAKATVSIDTLEESDPYYLVTLKDDTLYTGNAESDANNGVAVGELVREYLDGTLAEAPVYQGTDYTFYADAVSFARTLPVPEPTSGLLLTAAGLAVAIGSRMRRA
ncbi:hypothetical protein Pan181_00070 [Aeoliella mucimassa]|uniref:PEP-CTERM protein-sorting domain-containing protein n=2 Tax=Aeoliella mucimassa TaxID=2527972 RepID=A0A518AGK6_9BACT|nr:hypothetical protein Pan181_00070 [Aeoliella mucimassa]